MSTITKEWLQQAINDYESVRDELPFGLDEYQGNILSALRIALASLEAEPVAWLYSASFERGHVEGELTDAPGCDMPVYTAPPAPVSVPDAIEPTVEAVKRILPTSNPDDYAACIGADMWNACRAAMLQGVGNSPVIPNDVRRMDWLVSKTVDVREPMVYGSHSLFWSQTITDEEDDYHATKLREQIDAAMVAEQVVAPKQEVKS